MMTNCTRRHAWCIALIHRLNHEREWLLSPNDEQLLAASVLPYLPDECSEARLIQTVTAYYHDHQLVAALHHPNHADHNTAWEAWRSQVAAILRHANLLWSSDQAIDEDDLIQMACTELANALPKFRYASRFSTWARTVVVQRIQRHVRDSLARKRAQRPQSLDDDTVEMSAVLDTSEPIVTQAEASALSQMIESLLAAHPDQRLTTIYQLWIEQDQRIEDIGNLIHVHPSRIRQLIGHMRHFLREHAEFQAWLDAENHREHNGSH
jgi:RNA polymerase sigma factor (sigma-70 family)